MPNLGDFLEALKARLGEDLPDLADHLRVYDSGKGPKGPVLSDEGSAEPQYEVIIGIADAESVTEDYDYSRPGAIVLAIRLEAYTVFRITGEDATEYTPLNDANRILYWAHFNHIEGMVTLPIPFSGGISRGQFMDAYGNPTIDITRIAYRTWWDVLYAYSPSVIERRDVQDDGFRFTEDGGVIFGNEFGDDWDSRDGAIP